MPLPRQPITLATDGREPWDRQPGESTKRHDQFTVYRDLGRTRHWKKVAERFSLTRTTTQAYMRVYRWKERAHAYDQHMDTQWVAALAENSRRMVQEHLKVSRQLLARVQTRLENIDPDELTPQDCDRWLNTYSKLSRVALGEPETTVALTGGPAGTPIAITQVPSDETTRQAQMEAATLELARRLAGGGALDAEDILSTDL